MSVVARSEVRRGFYLDSVRLMQIAAALKSEVPGVAEAALMIGTPANLAILAAAGLLEAGADAGPNDLVIAVRARDEDAAEAALAAARAHLERRAVRAAGGGHRPRTLDSALATLAGANLALISVPGAFAAAEARRALRRGLNVMLFSDNVSVADEVALKDEALARGLLMMGPDCGTALLAGTPIGFANAVPRGAIGIVAASGTGLQEVSSLIARAGSGVSHGIGVGGRDLAREVGARMTLAALAALERDPITLHIVLVSKPPDPAVAALVLDRAARAKKPITVCFLGAEARANGGDRRVVATLSEAAERALGRPLAAARPGPRAASGRSRVCGAFVGGSLCAEAQTVLREGGLAVQSNAPIPGATATRSHAAGNALIDFGADEYTVGRPHPMIDPALRDGAVAALLGQADVAAILADVVLGFGAHPDPAGTLARVVAADPRERPLVIASVCGTAGDPQGYAGQVATLTDAGIAVAPSNAAAARAALVALGKAG
jgi:FdrA protein